MFEHPVGTCECDPAVLFDARPVEKVALSPEKLAARIDSALERADRVLFTITPREELDATEKWQRLQDEAWCGQLRHVVAATARMSAADRDFAGDELGLALGLSPLTGRAMVWEFGEIAALPGLVEAVESGKVSVRHVKAVMRVLDEVSLTLEQRQAIALVAVTEYRGETPGEWAARVRRLILRLDPTAAERRKQEKTAQRRVEFYPCADEQGAMWLTGPVEQLARVQARLRAEADRAKRAGDDRTVEQLMCDLAVGLLSDGILHGEVPAPYEVAVITPLSALQGSDETGELEGWGPISASTARDLAAQARSFTQVTVDQDGQVISVGDLIPADTLRDEGKKPASDEPARDESARHEAVSDEVHQAQPVADHAVGDEPTDSEPAEDGPGLSDPADDEQADDEPADEAPADERPDGDDPAPRTRQMLRAPTPDTLDRFLRQAADAMRQDPDIPILSTSSYRPGQRLRRFVQRRDRTCVFPGCRQPATQTDLDHRHAWPDGPTSADNLQCLCRHHHRAKQAVFTVLQEQDGTTVWITRGGWHFHRPPQGYP